MKCTVCANTLPARQAHKPRPPLKLPVQLDIVLAHEVDLAIVTDAEHGQRGGHVTHAVTVAHRHGHDAGRDHHVAAGLYADRADVDALRIVVLCQRLLTG